MNKYIPLWAQSLWSIIFGETYNARMHNQLEVGLCYLAALRWSFSVPQQWLDLLEEGRQTSSFKRQILRSYIRHHLRLYAHLLASIPIEGRDSCDIPNPKQLYRECAIVTGVSCERLARCFPVSGTDALRKQCQSTSIRQ